MNAYELPMSLTVNGRDYRIRTDFRVILDVLASQRDPDLSDRMKAYVMLKIMYQDYETIPPEDIGEALKMCVEFIDCGYRDDGKPKPRLVDWEQDARLIIPAINKVAHKEVRQEQYMHWWTFFSYYLEIGESLFADVVNIRLKKAKHKKLEKHEQEFYRENKSIIDLKVPESESARVEKDSILDFFKSREGGEKK